MKTHRFLFAFPLAFVVACSAESKPAPAGGAVTPDVIVKLAKADGVDGSVDKVVHKCAGCSLHMDGKAEFALQVQDYSMHFCKDECLAGFKADPAKAILAMVIDSK